MEEVVQCSQPATRLLIGHPRNGAISGIQCCFLLLEDLALSRNCIQVRHSEWKSMVLSPWISHISATMASFFMCPLSNEQNRSGEKLTVHRRGHPFYFMIELPLCWSHLLMSIYMGHKYLQIFCPFREIRLQTSSQLSFSLTFKSCFFQVPDHPADPLVQPMC